ncbi:MAG: sigma-54-dependent Fis family transcriptional regulator [Calditrichae bacterium]|nr:sigma-54-dependent Fis family transcriptional regulator [Calditrichia bacterium]
MITFKTNIQQKERPIDRQKTILIVDDEQNIRESLMKVLSRENYAVLPAASAKDAISLLGKHAVDLVISDIMMPEMDGLSLLKRIKQSFGDVEVLLITGHATVEMAVEAMREGAHDFIAKPFKRADILARVQRVLEKQGLVRENRQLKTQLKCGVEKIQLIGESPEIRRIRQMIEQIAPMPSTVLINGESGTGKEIIARQLHEKSDRADKPFVAVNCGAIAEQIIESELFGHVKGAFTGAVAEKDGLFKTADGGSLFLDEVGSLSPNMQVKLLRVLEEREVRPVGAIKTFRVDVRILAACNSNLQAAVEAGQFREDLYYRLNVISIFAPPLRERREDIALLANHFIRQFNVDLMKNVTGMTVSAAHLLVANPWKGNVRELRNAIEHAMILTTGTEISAEDLPLRYHHPQQNGHVSGITDLKAAVNRFEREHITKILQHCDGDKKTAAEKLGLSLSSLYRKMSELNISDG